VAVHLELPSARPFVVGEYVRTMAFFLFGFTICERVVYNVAVEDLFSAPGRLKGEL
jgi:hypothetical protein